MVQITTITHFFLFIKEHLKIILLVCLPSYGILINFVVIDQYALLTNPIVMIIMAMLNMPFFYDITMYKHEWIIHPILNVISNLIFWIPTALLINRAYQKRKLRK